MPIVVFDSLCNFCSASVRFILRHDVRGRIRFAPAQSQLGRSLLEQHGLDPDEPRSLLLIKAGKAYLRSDAVLEIARDLSGWWRWLRIFRFVPKAVRDGLYRVLAQNRYRWFGKCESCFVPTEQQRSRFLGDLDDAPEAH